MIERLHIMKRSKEKGFTLVESLIVVGLTTLLAVGVVMGFLEGLDTLHSVTDSRSVEFGHQRSMNIFIRDVQAATWFCNNLDPMVHQENGSEVLRETVTPYELTLGYPGSDGVEIWVRYKVRVDPFMSESYLLRTIVTSSGDPIDNGMTILSTGIANLEFTYVDRDGEFTDLFPDIAGISMTLSINVGGATMQREYYAALRNPNMDVALPPGDFDAIETGSFTKLVND